MDAITPKHHAEVIFSKLRNLATATATPKAIKQNAKQSGLLFCEEMLKSIDHLKNNTKGHMPAFELMESMEKHWKEVKSEIEKMA